MSLLAIIPARGGSKRIPKKNIKDFMGKPIIAYAIEACKDAQIFDEIMVSTDDYKIKNIAEEYGAKVPFMRSQKTSDDFAIIYEVLEEVIFEYKKIGKKFNHLCCIYPCVPLLQSMTLKTAYESFKENNCDTLLPVLKFSFPIQRAFMINNQGFLEYREPENALKRSQDLEPMYQDAGMFCFSDINEMLKNKKDVGNKVAYLELNEKEVQDIDTVEDWEIAEFKYKLLNEDKHAI